VANEPFFTDRRQVRGGWRCSLCSITYPNDRTKFKVCLACNDQCDYMSNGVVDEDWLDKVHDLIMHWEGGAHDSFPAEWQIPPQTPDEREAGAEGGT
jgi:hypothetical protein